MKRTILAVAVAALALTAPGALAAGPPTYSTCRILNARYDDVTGENVFAGIAVGVAVSDELRPATMTCEVRINGVPVSATPPGQGLGVISTYGEVVYAATERDVVELCTRVVWDDTGETFEVCDPTLLFAVPPKEVADIIRNHLFGTCVVPTEPCEGFCVVNLGTCGHGCFAVVNVRECDGVVTLYFDP